VVADPKVEFRIVERGSDAPASDFGSGMFRAIAEATRAADPSLVVVPYLSTGATDSARLRQLGMQAFGILPFPMNQNDEDRMHGHDERVPVAALAFGTRVIYGALVRVAR
jgi:acetylornithine deacetylase/succinyl-diaminopimelate desuccinylase-like protein